MSNCRKCKVHLIVGENWKPSSVKRQDYICKVCRRTGRGGERLTIKLETIEAYGGKCVCCGETTAVFLTIDHIHGGGTKERQETKRGGYNFYYWLKAQGFPKDKYQLLCFNCNYAKHALGKCPHQA